MFIFLSIMIVFSFVALIILTAMQPPRTKLSAFELDRRAKMGDNTAKESLVRDKAINDLISLRRVLTALLLITIGFMSVANFSWLVGILISLFVIFEYGAIARIGFIKKISSKLYRRIEMPIINFTKKHPRVISLLRSAPVLNSYSQYIGSRQELQYLISKSDAILTPDEKKMIVNSLEFSHQTVSTIMTSRNKIASINKSEFLGPLALDDLHKTGHGRLPVVDGDIDHIVGILDIKNLLTLDVRMSKTAEKLMDPKVFYLRSDQTLPNALAAFLQTHSSIFIVVNKDRETVGVLSLSDIIEFLVGRKLVDKFEDHDRLDAVVNHNPLD